MQAVASSRDPTRSGQVAERAVVVERVFSVLNELVTLPAEIVGGQYLVRRGGVDDVLLVPAAHGDAWRCRPLDRRLTSRLTLRERDRRVERVDRDERVVFGALRLARRPEPE